MITNNFEDKKCGYAYNSIHDFFDQYNLDAALKELESVIKAATKKKAWKKDYPYRLIYFMNQLEELCEQALVIHYNASVRKECIVEKISSHDQPDLQQLQQFVGNYNSSGVWNCIPRHLNASQYFNPYKAIKKFADHLPATAWKNALKNLTEYALSNSCIDDEHKVQEVLSVRLHLLRLIEACHLLDVRRS